MNEDKASLYAYNEGYSYGELFFFFTATSKQLERIWEKEVYWDDELGKHSEGYYRFDAGTVSIVNVVEEAIKELAAHTLIPYWDIDDIIYRVEENQ